MEPRLGAIVRATLYITIGLMLSCAERPDRRHATSNVSRAKNDTPPGLQQIDRKATDIIVAVRTGDWPRVDALVQDINRTWVDCRNQISGLEVPQVGLNSSGTSLPGSPLVDRLNAAVYLLQHAATARNSSQTTKTASLVSTLADDLFEYYSPAIPPDIHRLRGLERQIVLDAADANLVDVSAMLGQARDVWHRVRPSVEAKAGVTCAVQIEASLAGQQAALDGGDSALLTSRAKRALESLGEAERLY